MMSDEQSMTTPPCKSGRNNNSGRGGRGGPRGARHSSSPASFPCSQPQRGRGRGPGRGNGNHGRQARQRADSSSSFDHPNRQPNLQHRNNRGARQRPRSHSHECYDYAVKRSVEGPYAHLFCSERHGFALSRVLYPSDETSLLVPSAHAAPVSRTGFKAASASQLEKWWEAVKLVRCLVAFDQSHHAVDSGPHCPSSSSSLDRCPICLDDQMTCPHIAPCGHSFCLPCVLGYLNAVAKQIHAEAARTHKSKQTGHNNSNSNAVVGSDACGNRNAVTVTTVCARCPMCSSGSSVELNAGDAMITYRDLRPLLFVPVATIRPAGGGKQQHSSHVGTIMKFVKLHRVQTCAAPYLPLLGHCVRGVVQGDAASSTSASPSQYHHYFPNLPDGDDDADECMYSRQYFVGSNEYDGLLQRNFDELLNYRDTSIHCQMDPREKWNVSMAIEAIQASMRRWTGNDGDDGGFRALELAARVHSTREVTVLDSPIKYADDANQEVDIVNNTNSALIPPGTAYLSRELDECFFYQACDGQLAFLSGINVACLLEEFSLHRNEHSTDQSNGSRRAHPLPDAVEGTVVGTESFVVTPSLVKKKQFLSHLPVGSSVVFVEIDWYSGGNNKSQPMLTKATLSKFRSEIQRRKLDRQRAFQIEEKADKLAQMKVDKEDRIRREKAFGSAYVDGIPRQTIDPDDEFFKVPLASMDDSINFHGDQHTTSLAFKFNEVCATGGVWPALSTAAAVAPVSPVSAGVTMARSPRSLPLLGKSQC
eukprot:CCRYP_015873-RA/>CCRYP_015873-RA protein AED:0.02 eAED:0.02 QI:333/1/1/1/1/1/2/535/761